MDRQEVIERLMGPFNYGDEADNLLLVPEHLLEDCACLLRQEWIPVAERLPEVGEKVLTFENHGDWESIDSCYWDRLWKANHVTHWQPLPSPPTGE